MLSTESVSQAGSFLLIITQCKLSKFSSSSISLAGQQPVTLMFRDSPAKCRNLLTPLLSSRWEECPSGDNQWGVEGYQSLNYPPCRSFPGLQEALKWVTSFPTLPHDRKPAVCYCKLSLGVLSLWNSCLEVLSLGKENKHAVRCWHKLGSGSNNSILVV